MTPDEIARATKVRALVVGDYMADAKVYLERAEMADRNHDVEASRRWRACADRALDEARVTAADDLSNYHSK